MKFYFAPFEGITGYIYRNAYADIFQDKPDKFFAPFIAVSRHGKPKHREIADISPENNRGLFVVPQILGNDPQAVLDCIRQLEALGYKEVNLNIGCPYSTVVSKKKGAGLLAEPGILEELLEKVCGHSPLPVSVKTRIGMESGGEWETILEIYNKYPLEELIVHPRVRADFYKNKPDMDAYGLALHKSRAKVCYNGDIFTVEDYQQLIAHFPQTKAVMLGRGMLCNPMLLGEISGMGKVEQGKIRQFHDRVYEDYQKVIPGEINTLFKMKELWNYMQYLFENREKYIKKIRKAQRLAEYESAVRALFAECAMKEAAGFEGEK